MGLGILLGILFIGVTFSAIIHPKISPTDTWEMVWLGGTLIVLGFLAPNIWLGLLLAWIGMQIPWTQLAARWGVRPIAAMPRIIGRQVVVLVGASLYVALSLSGYGLTVLQPLALIVALWALFNAVAAGLATPEKPVRGRPESVRTTLPGRKEVVQSLGWYEAAYVGSSHMLSWLCGIGALSLVYLAMTWPASTHYLWLVPLPLLAVAALLSKNYTGMISGVAGVAAFLALTSGYKAILALLAVGLVLLVMLAPLEQLRRRRRLWKAVLGDALSWTGRGLGFVSEQNYTFDDEMSLKWDHLHNDWLQGLVELGPLAVLLFLGYLVTTVVGLGADPLSAYAFSILFLTSTQALTYFPTTLPGQMLPALVAMSALS